MIDPRDFGRLEGKVDQILANQTETRLAQLRYEDRLRAIEHKQSVSEGKASINGALAGGVMGTVLGIVGKWLGLGS
jgi:hypothetical protein